MDHFPPKVETLTASQLRQEWIDFQLPEVIDDDLSQLLTQVKSEVSDYLAGIGAIDNIVTEHIQNLKTQFRQKAGKEYYSKLISLLSELEQLINGGAWDDTRTPSISLLNEKEVFSLLPWKTQVKNIVGESLELLDPVELKLSSESKVYSFITLLQRVLVDIDRDGVTPESTRESLSNALKDVYYTIIGIITVLTTLLEDWPDRELTSKDINWLNLVKTHSSKGLTEFMDGNFFRYFFGGIDSSLTATSNLHPRRILRPGALSIEDQQRLVSDINSMMRILRALTDAAMSLENLLPMLAEEAAAKPEKEA